MTDIKKAHKLLTVAQATKQARRHVDRIMPGVMATVESKESWDLDTDTAIVVTTITFPANCLVRDLLALALMALPGRIDMKGTPESIRITRTR